MCVGRKLATEGPRKKKKLGICIPTWNRHELLKQAVESVLPQLTHDCGLIVVDNHSTDGTEDYLASVSDQVSSIRHPENLGYLGNYAACLQLYDRFDWIAILHSDDLYAEGAVAAILKAIENFPTVGLIFSQQHQINSQGHRVVDGVAQANAALLGRGHESVLRCQSQIPCSSSVYRGIAIANAGMPSEEFAMCADEEYNARIAKDWDIVELDTILSCYRRHEFHTMRETWKKLEFIPMFTKMRLRMNEHLPLDYRKSGSDVEWDAASALLGSCSYLDAIGDTDVAERFYRNAFSRSKHKFLTNRSIVLRWVLHKIPLLNTAIARRLSKNFSNPTS